MINIINQPILFIYFSIIFFIFSPPKYIKEAIRKNLAPLPITENKTNPKRLIPVIPAAMVNILYGIGENPANRIAHIPHLENQILESSYEFQ